MVKGRSSAPSPARRARTRACCFRVRDTGGLEGREAEGDCHGEAGISLQRRRSTGLGHHHPALPPPAESDNNSQLSVTLTFLLCHKSD